MDYKKHYEQLIESRRSLNRKKGDGNYYEKHHIIPKCCNGSNDKENLVLLTFKEHFIAHLLLTRMYDGELKRKMFYALWRMVSFNKNVKRIVSASQYKICKDAALLASINRFPSKETKDKIRNTLLGHSVSKETRNKISLKGKGRPSPNKGKEASIETRKKITNAQLGRKQSKETINKRIKSNTGKKRTKEVVDNMIKNNPNNKKIYCHNNDTIYDSMSQAARDLKLNVNLIWFVCVGRRKSTGGHKFNYV